jgi:hypothetical protein
MRRHRWTTALALAAGLAAGACSSDANGPADVNPQVISSGMSGLTSSFSGNLAFQSLRGLSGSFGFTAVGAAVRATAPTVPGAARDFALTPAQRQALLQGQQRARRGPPARRRRAWWSCRP